MSEERFRAFFEESIAGYAEDNRRAGRWSKEGALAASRAEHERLLPQRLATPDHYLRSILDGSTGRRVGDVWYAVRGEDGPKAVWIFWLGIDPDHRRHGYAAGALEAVEEDARRLGLDRVGLHVFAENTGARALYDRMGFEMTNVVMWKRLAS
jgi:RimJ/RimL family protein N-acetyltransferase